MRYDILVVVHTGAKSDSCYKLVQELRWKRITRYHRAPGHAARRPFVTLKVKPLYENIKVKAYVRDLRKRPWKFRERWFKSVPLGNRRFHRKPAERNSLNCRSYPPDALNLEVTCETD